MLNLGSGSSGGGGLAEPHSGVSMQMMVPMKDAVDRRDFADVARAAATAAAAAAAESGSDGGAADMCTPVRSAAFRDRDGGRAGLTPTPLRRGMRNMAFPSPRLLRVSGWVGERVAGYTIRDMEHPSVIHLMANAVSL